MLIKWGALVVDGRGKMGGQVASRNRQGAYMRNKVTPVNPQSIYQQIARSLLASFSAQWRGLTQAQRDAWDGAVAQWQQTNVFADIVFPTGKNLFTKLNINLANISVASLSAPPVPQEVVEPVITTVTSDPASLVVVFDDETITEGQDMLIFATPPISAGKSFVKNQYKMLEVAVVVPAVPTDITAMYTARFGAPVTGQKICVKAVPVVNATGQKGIGSALCAIVQ